MTPFRIIDQVYYVGTAGLGSYLITSDAGHVLIDGALPESAAQIAKHIEELGFSLRDVRYILNTHAHYDHCGGLAELQRRTGAKLVASQADKPALESGACRGSDNTSAPNPKVQRVIADGGQLTVGPVTLTAHLMPAHTRGCTSWSLPVHDVGKEYQALFFCSTTVAANRLVGTPTYPGILENYERVFAKAKQLHVDVFLAPHAEFFGLHDKRARLAQGSGPNPFIDPAEYEAFLTKSEASFRSELAQQRAALPAPR
jgi:metallo-beta-lactamase class B